MSLTYSFNIQNGDDIDADEVMANFGDVQDDVDLKQYKSTNIRILEETYSVPILGFVGVMIIPEALTITEVTTAAGVTPSGGACTIDLHNSSDDTIYTTQANRPSIADGTVKGTVTAPDTVSFPKDDYLRVYFDEVNSAQNVKVQIRYRSA